MYVASQPSDLQRTGPGEPQPPQPAPGTAVVPEPIFENEVEGVVKAGSINIATTGPGAQTFVLSAGIHGDVTIHFPGAPLGTALAPGEVGTVAQLQEGVRVTVEGRLASDAQTFEAARVELVAAPVTKDVTHGTLVSFANGKLAVLVNGVQKTYTITGNTQFRPDDKTAADLVGLASGNKVTVVSERDVAKGVVIYPR
jgi:hypothetical protein